MSTTAISAVTPRKRTTVEGRVRAVSARVSPSLWVDVEIEDPTGSVTLRFIGRSEVPGMSTGRVVRVDGTPRYVGPALVMLNPLYEFQAGSTTWE